MFPGGLYNSEEQRLVIPLPAWNTSSLNDLRGLAIRTRSTRLRGSEQLETCEGTPDSDSGDDCERSFAENLGGLVVRTRDGSHCGPLVAPGKTLHRRNH